VARLYTNENFPLQCAKFLRKFGHDVLTIQESGNAGISMPDDEVLAFARDEKRILITMNRKHFIYLHQQSDQHTGIIVCNYNPDYEELAKRIQEVLESKKNFYSQLVRVHR
jgi:predicted nuclease of predicted toxin-antitoxin system